MAKKQSKSGSGLARQRALVIGISNYPRPEDYLGGVAADVREMSKLLASKHGTFPADGVLQLIDNAATHDKILEELERVFGDPAGDTVFVYIAGHGFEEGGKYYFMAHDTIGPESAVPLAEIKNLFDESKSRRVFLWLDFCRSGGIIARRKSANELELITREIGVVRGEGKILVAACTSTQSAYESIATGHGNFTHALLAGLKGAAKNRSGEVTAHSLFDFIDQNLTSPIQRPVFLGQSTGRIVLVHYPQTAAATKKSAKRPATRAATSPSRRPGTWVMLGDNFLLADSVKHSAESKLQISATTTTGAQSAMLESLRPRGFGHDKSLPFASGTSAYVVEVLEVESELTGTYQKWTLSLAVEELVRDFGSDISFRRNNGTTISPEDFARMRAGRVLLNDLPPRSSSRRGMDSDDLSLGFIDGSGRYTTKECVVREVFKQLGSNPDWRQFARLSAMFVLKAAGVVDRIHELTIGPVRANRVPVAFRGDRQRYANEKPMPIEVSGSCSLA